jgi:hypothetical protein
MFFIDFPCISKGAAYASAPPLACVPGKEPIINGRRVSPLEAAHARGRAKCRRWRKFFINKPSSAAAGGDIRQIRHA